MEDVQLQVIAHIRNDFREKFGIPRQSGLVEDLKSYITFEPGFRNADMIRGLEGFSHIWLIWHFSKSRGWSPMVRPPRLGGNTRIGVFATRSPFRPSPVGLSCVRLDKITPYSRFGPILRVAGADLMDGTPIYDIKPYLPYTDSRPYAQSGFVARSAYDQLSVECSDELLSRLPEDRRAGFLSILAQDPRPAYQHDPQRVYGFSFGGFNIHFSVQNARLTVLDIEESTRQATMPLPEIDNELSRQEVSHVKFGSIVDETTPTNPVVFNPSDDDSDL